MDVTYYFDEVDNGTYLTDQYDYVTFFGLDGSTVRATTDGSQSVTVINGRGNTMCCAPYDSFGNVFKGNFGFVLNAPYRVSFHVGYTDQPGSTTIRLYSDVARTKQVDQFVPDQVGYMLYTSTMRIRAMELRQVNEAAGTEIDNLTIYDVRRRIKRQRQSPLGTPSRIGWR